jgi:hypothetical protein
LANQESDAQPRRLELDAAVVCALTSSVHSFLFISRPGLFRIGGT